MKLYRASDSPLASPFSSFSPDIETAISYTDNRGFGGSKIYAYEVHPEKALELYDGRHTDSRKALDKLAQVIAPLRAPKRQWEEGDWDWRDLSDEWGGSYGHLIFHILERDRHINRDLRELGYDWISHVDDFPDGAETWRWLGWKMLRGKRVPKKDWPRD